MLAIFENKNQIWTFYCQFARILAGLAFIFLLARSLSSNQLGVWYVFVSLFGVASLLEMGLSQVIGRHAACIKADAEVGKIGARDILKMAKLGEIFYIAVSFIIITFCGFVGFLWLDRNVSAELSGHMKSLYLAWLIYVSAGGLTIIGTYYAAIINGCGDMWKSQKILVYATIASIATLTTIFFVGPTLLIPAMAMFVSQFLAFFLLRKTFIDVLPIASNDRVSFNIRATLKNIRNDAFKMFLLVAYHHILTNGLLLIFSEFISPSDLASYGLTMQLIIVVTTMSMAWSRSNFYLLASAHKKNDLINFRKNFVSTLWKTLSVSAVGMLGIFIVGPFFLEIIGSKTTLLAGPVLGLVLIVFWVEFGFMQFIQMLIAKGEMKVTYFSFVAALVIGFSASFLLASGASLLYVFWIRLLIFFFFLGVPVAFFTVKAFGGNKDALRNATKVTDSLSK